MGVRGWGGWHSRAQICQGIGSKDEGFEHIMGELEHTAREQRDLTQPGCAHLEPRETALGIPAPCCTHPTPTVILYLSFSSHHPWPVTPRT